MEMANKMIIIPVHVLKKSIKKKRKRFIVFFHLIEMYVFVNKINLFHILSLERKFDMFIEGLFLTLFLFLFVVVLRISITIVGFVHYNNK